MCIACEQDFMWLAYLESRGLIAPDNPAMTRDPFAALPAEPTPPEQAPSNAPEPAERPGFSCDDPTE